MFARGCVCVRVYGGARVSPWGQGGCAENTTSSARVRVGVCLRLAVSGAALPCVGLEDGCPHSCVSGVVALRVTVCACFGVTSCFSVCVGVCVAELWQRVTLSLVVSKQLSAVQLCALVSLYVRQRLRVWPSITTLSLVGVCRSCGADPQRSAVVLYLLPLFAAALPLAGRSAGPKEAWVGGPLAS